MQIEQATLNDIRSIMLIYDDARKFMHKSGNHQQWINGYPSEALMIHDIECHHCYVCRTEDDEIVGVFCFIIGDDPTYAYIENGHWLSDAPYGTIHRLASNGRTKHIADRVIAWCVQQIPNLRADTHADNLVMQKALERNGFERCGIIYVANGTPRIAYQRSVD